MSFKTIVINEEMFGRNIPTASIGRERLSLSVSACDLIGIREKDYKYVEFMRDTVNENIIGLRFWNKNANDNCVLVKQKTDNGKKIGGIEIANKQLLESIFGDVANGNTITRFRVKKYELSPYILLIDTTRK